MYKPHIPLRPIISCIGALRTNFPSISLLLSPHWLGSPVHMHVLNSKHFVGMMKDARMEAEEALVSFDVTLLFTNVPIDEAVDVIHRKLTKEEEDLVEQTPLPVEDRRAPSAV